MRVCVYSWIGFIIFHTLHNMLLLLADRLTLRRFEFVYAEHNLFIVNLKVVITYLINGHNRQIILTNSIIRMNFSQFNTVEDSNPDKRGLTNQRCLRSILRAILNCEPAF